MAIKKVTQQVIKEEVWTAVAANGNPQPSFGSGWLNYGDPFQRAGFVKDANGFVHMRGLIKSGTLGTSVFTLPAGYRPVYQMLLPVCCSTATGAGRIDISTNGTVNVHATMAANGYLSLDGIVFRAEQ